MNHLAPPVDGGTSAYYDMSQQLTTSSNQPIEYIDNTSIIHHQQFLNNNNSNLSQGINQHQHQHQNAACPSHHHHHHHPLDYQVYEGVQPAYQQQQQHQHHHNEHATRHNNLYANHNHYHHHHQQQQQHERIYTNHYQQQTNGRHQHPDNNHHQQSPHQNHLQQHNQDYVNIHQNQHQHQHQQVLVDNMYLHHQQAQLVDHNDNSSNQGELYHHQATAIPESTGAPAAVVATVEPSYETIQSAGSFMAQDRMSMSFPSQPQNQVLSTATSASSTIQAYDEPQITFVSSSNLQQQQQLNQYQHHQPVQQQQQQQQHYQQCSIKQQQQSACYIQNEHDPHQQQMNNSYQAQQPTLILGSSEEFSEQQQIHNNNNGNSSLPLASSAFYPNQADQMDLLPTIKQQQQQQQQTLAFHHHHHQQQNSVYQSSDAVEHLSPSMVAYNQVAAAAAACKPALLISHQELEAKLPTSQQQNPPPPRAELDFSPTIVSVAVEGEGLSGQPELHLNKSNTYANIVATSTAISNDDHQCNSLQYSQQQSNRTSPLINNNNNNNNNNNIVTNESDFSNDTQQQKFLTTNETTITINPTKQQSTDPTRRQTTDFIDMKPGGNMSQDWLDNICTHLIDHMDRFGICVIDNFLGSIKGDLILREVKQLYSSGQYIEGRVVNNKIVSSKTLNGDSSVIRNDRVIWVEGSEEGCFEINNLIQTLCSVITNSSRLSLYTNNGLDKIVINKRTKAHVTCYPGNGTRYIKHVDNPNNDGRVITSIYYINKDWNTKRDGGLLRMFPVGVDQVANIEPLFDRVLFFWSDRRNPHEVLPAYKDRFAITVWYIGENRTSNVG